MDIGALFDWKLWNQNQIITMANQKKGKYPEEPMRTQNKTKSLQWPIRRKENTLKSQWELKMKPTNMSKARENSTDQVVIGFSFALIGWKSDASFSGQITEGSK